MRNARDSLDDHTGVSIGDAVISTDVSGRIVLINRAAQDMLRWPEKEALGKPLEEVFQVVNELSHERLE